MVGRTEEQDSFTKHIPVTKRRPRRIGLHFTRLPCLGTLRASNVARRERRPSRRIQTGYRMCVGACAGAASERLRATTCLIEEKRVRCSPDGKTHTYTRMWPSKENCSLYVTGCEQSSPRFLGTRNIHSTPPVRSVGSRQPARRCCCSSRQQWSVLRLALGLTGASAGKPSEASVTTCV